MPEANFFAIVVSIQQRAGGNLSEALGNLSRVLRDRKKMKAKIQAMSQEAKASAAIIGALPIAVMTLVWITSPAYIDLLWTDPLGRVMLGVLRRLDAVRRAGDAQNDQFRFLGRRGHESRSSPIISMQVLTMMFAAVAAGRHGAHSGDAVLSTDTLASA